MKQNIKQIFSSQKTRASYGVIIVRAWEKIDRVITAPHCISTFKWRYISFMASLYTCIFTFQRWIISGDEL